MTRQDYDEIKRKLTTYVGLWNTRNYETAEELFDPYVTFCTSTSLTMTDGAQHSIFGVRDFLMDYPFTEALTTEVVNYVCRTQGDRAVTYAEIVCSAANGRENTFGFHAALTAEWRKTALTWKIVDLKQEIIPSGGSLRSYFKSKWFLDSEGKRESMIQGEADSPWNRIPQNAAPLTEEEQAIECLVKYLYGMEQETFQHCYEAMSPNFGVYTDHSGGERRRGFLAAAKKRRKRQKHEPHPLKIRSIELDGNSAVIHADRLAEHPEGGLCSCGRETYELQREPDGWRIVYMDAYPGIYKI